MKKLLVATALIASLFAIGGNPSPLLAAPASPAVITYDCLSASSDITTIFGDVGDTFALYVPHSPACGLADDVQPWTSIVSVNEVDSDIDPTTSDFDPVSDTIGGDSMGPCAEDCTVEFEIVSSGTFKFGDPSAGVLTITIDTSGGGGGGGGGSHRPSRPTIKGTVDANGGTCPEPIGTESWKFTSPSNTPVLLPGLTECTRERFKFIGWQTIAGIGFVDAGLSEDADGRFLVDDTGTHYFRAAWEPASPREIHMYPGSTINRGVAARIYWGTSASPGAQSIIELIDASSHVVFSADIPFDGVDEAHTKTYDFMVTELVPDAPYVVQIYAVVDGVRSPVARDWGTTNLLIAGPVEPQRIVIVGERGSVNGKTGILVEGTATGLPNGTRVKPWVRFPGQSEYSESSARPEVVNGEFHWERKTGKKAYVYFTTEDGTVVSNRIIIQAA